MTPPVAGLAAFTATIARLDHVGCDGSVTAYVQRTADAYAVSAVAQEWSVGLSHNVSLPDMVAELFQHLPPTAQNVQVWFHQEAGTRRLVVRSYLPVR